MTARLLCGWVAACACAWGQFGTGGTTFTVRHAGGYDDQRRDGMCTIRVMVDQEVDVELRWDKVRIQAIRGRVGRDDGSECNAPLQQGGITNFQFRGIDGRGQVSLREQPNPGNGWAAIVRINDPRGGEEGYTFQLSWNWDGSSPGGGGGGWNPGYNARPYCQNAISERLRREGNRITSFSQPERTWQDGYRHMFEGAAVANMQGRIERIVYTCGVNPNNNYAETADYRVEGSSGGGGGWNPGPGFDIREACREAFRQRLRRDNRGDISGWSNPPDRNWMQGNRAMYEGGARVSWNGMMNDVVFTCAFNPSTQYLHSVDYQFQGGSGGGGGGGGGYLPPSRILSLCQQQLRARFQQDFNSRNAQFTGSPERWMDGQTERITGNGYVMTFGRRTNFGYSCAGNPQTNNLDWSDYQVATPR